MNDPEKTDDKLYSMRLHFPDDESKHQWLPMLLDAYAIIDKGVSIAIDEEREKRKVELACKNGCATCCRTHNDIPVYPLELVGIYWFTIEKMDKSLRENLKRQLANYKKEDPCPFLIDSSCSIHPVRPVACRQFNVFNKPCDKGEDPYYIRRDDVLTPIQDYTARAFFIMLPFYGISDEAARIQAVKNNLLHTQIRILQSCNWKALAGRIDEFDAQKR